MKDSARYILPILVFVAFILSIGTGGYLIIEDGISVSDAFYMAVTAITPTQFDEVHKLSVPGRYFTVVLVFCGFGAVVAFATQFARLIVQSELEGVGVITRKQMSRRIRQMKNHYIVCGYGEIGGAICGELKEHELPFVVVADDEPSVTASEREGHPLVRGNPTADASLKDAGIERAVGVIAVLADDADNLFISLAARELNPQILIISRGEDSSVEDRILRAGADIVVSPMKLGGRQIAALIQEQIGGAPLADRTSTRASVMGLRLTVHRHLTEDPTTVGEILSQTEAVGAAAVKRSDGSFTSNPPNDTIVHGDDVVVLIIRTEETGDVVHRQVTGKVILLADDHRALRLLFARKLAAAGHHVIQAASGDEAVASARSHEPDLIVLDVNMPNRNGYEVCRALRELPRFAHTPIILYSGDETAEFAQRGRDSGADMCIRKTSKSSELLAKIEEAFTNQDSSASGTNVSETTAGKRLAQACEPDSHDPSASQQAFDMKTALDNVGGDAQLLNELLNTLLEETPALMDRINLAVQQSDYNELRVAAHTLKSSVAIVGADVAAAAAGKVEMAASGGNLEAIDQLHTELAVRIRLFNSAIQQHCSDLCKQ